MEGILDLLNSVIGKAELLVILLIITGVLFILSLILLIITVITLKRQKKVENRIDSFMGPVVSQLNMEKLLVDFVKNSRDVAKTQEDIKAALNAIDDKIDSKIKSSLSEFNNKTEKLEGKTDIINNAIDGIYNTLSYAIQKIGIVRYNPFPDVGGDLSFSLAMLDKTNSGFVMTGIYSRQGSFTYLKPVRKGKGDESDKRYRLSAEETEAVQRAVVAH